MAEQGDAEQPCDHRYRFLHQHQLTPEGGGRPAKVDVFYCTRCLAQVGVEERPPDNWRLPKSATAHAPAGPKRA